VVRNSVALLEELCPAIEGEDFVLGLLKPQILETHKQIDSERLVMEVDIFNVQKEK
jgi:hypothetical protein